MEEKNSNFFRDFLIVVLSSIIAITCVIVANNYGLIKLYSINSPASSSQAETETTLTISDVAKKGIACSVSVYLMDSTGSYFTSAGSGVILKYDAEEKSAYVITNDHVIASSYSGGIYVYYLNSYYNATLIGTDPENDIAVLSFKVFFTPAVAEIGRSLTDLVVGEQVVAVGNAAALDYTVTDGIISNIGRKEDVSGIEKNYVQTSAVINAGNSGGGLFDLEGKLIAINTMGLSNYDDINFSLPLRFDSSIEINNTVYNRAKRDAITSFNCLIEKHKELVDAEVQNTVGYIDGQKYVGAKFEFLTKASAGSVSKYVYVSDIYSYFDLETSSYQWQTPIRATETDTTNYLIDTISKVEYSIDGGTTWIVGIVESSTSNTIVFLSGNTFSSIELMNFVNKQTMGTLLRFTVQTKNYNNLTGALTNVGTAKTTTAKVSQYQFEYAS